jgi:putative transposase
VQARYCYRFYPTPEQEVQLARTFGCVRYVYNWALAMKQDALRQRTEKVSCAETDRRLTAHKRQEETAWLREVSSVPLKQALRHLDKAYTAFFRGTSRLPRFKVKGHRQSASYTRFAFSPRNSGVAGQPVVKLAKQNEPLDIVWSRPLPSDPSSLIVIKESDGRYYVSFVVEVSPEPLAKIKRAVGIDLGVKDVLVASEGWKSGNPKYLGKNLEKLRRAQKVLSRKRRGSSNWHKQRLKVARIQARKADQRRDYLHQLSTRLVRGYDMLCCESLAVKNMVRNLALVISDAGWGTLVGMLRYKAKWYGRTLMEVGRWYPSSKTCSACRYTTESLLLSVRHWKCPECATQHDRDENAAKNILAVGTAVAACGEGVRPVLASASGVPVKEAGIPCLRV